MNFTKKLSEMDLRSAQALIEAYHVIFEGQYRIPTSHGTTTVNDDDVDEFIRERGAYDDEDYMISMCTLGLREVCRRIDNIIDLLKRDGMETKAMDYRTEVPSEILGVINAYEYLENFAKRFIPEANTTEHALISSYIRMCAIVVNVFIKARARNIEKIEANVFANAENNQSENIVDKNLMQKLVFMLSTR